MVYCSPFEAGRRSTIVREFESRPLRHSSPEPFQPPRAAGRHTPERAGVSHRNRVVNHTLRPNHCLLKSHQAAEQSSESCTADTRS